MNWHARSCSRPDVQYLDGKCTWTPCCVSCGHVAPERLEGVGSLSHAPCIPEASSGHGGLRLGWPSSVSWVPSVGDAAGEPEAPPARAGSSGPARTTTGIYQPVVRRQMRLLTLHRGAGDDALHGDLAVADLAAHPEYEALSYTWADSQGGSAKCRAIYMGPRWDLLPITANCEAALRRLRWNGLDRVLWIDAICIDQSNAAERTQQVGMMQYIYATADRVFIYLGDQGHATTPVESLLWRPYFSRVWVIQEIASARRATVVYGAHEMPWADFYAMSADKARRGEHQNLAWLAYVDRPRYLLLDELYDVLLDTGRCHATDPRDKVFAVLGLFMDAAVDGLLPDYTMSVRDLFIGITAYLLSRNNPYETGRVLMHAMQQRQRDQKVPTWALSWTAFQEQPPVDYSALLRDWYQKALQEDNPNPPHHFNLVLSSFPISAVHGQTIFNKSGAMITTAVPLARLTNPRLHFTRAEHQPTDLPLRYTFGDSKEEAGARKETVEVTTQEAILDGDQVFVLKCTKYPVILRQGRRGGSYSLISPCQLRYPTSWLQIQGLFWNMMMWDWLLSPQHPLLNGGSDTLYQDPKWFQRKSWKVLREGHRAFQRAHRIERRCWLKRLVWKAVFIDGVKKVKLALDSNRSWWYRDESVVENALSQLESHWFNWAKRCNRTGQTIRQARGGLQDKFFRSSQSLMNDSDVITAERIFNGLPGNVQLALELLIPGTAHRTEPNTTQPQYALAFWALMRMDLRTRIAMTLLVCARHGSTTLSERPTMELKKAVGYVLTSFRNILGEMDSFDEVLTLDHERCAWRAWLEGGKEPTQGSFAGQITAKMLKEKGEWTNVCCAMDALKYEVLPFEDVFMDQVALWDKAMDANDPVIAQTLTIV